MKLYVIIGIAASFLIAFLYMIIMKPKLILLGFFSFILLFIIIYIIYKIENQI